MKKNKAKLTLTLMFILLFVISFSYLNFFNFQNLATLTANNLQDKNSIDINNSNDTQTPSNQNNNAPQKENAKITNTSTCVSVGEIWNNTTKKFKKNELLQLIKCATNTNITINNLNALKGRTINANDMRTYNSSKDILVILGGLQWTATYFSQDTNGNPILTLWLANSTSTSTWNSGFYPNNTPSSKYPDAMYGTSYMRAVVLNNGGWYSTSSGGGSGTTATKSSSNKFAQFTITTNNKTAISDYLVTQKYVSWQKHQSYKEQRVDPTFLYNRSNDGWEKYQSNSNYITDGYGYYNYSDRDKYDIYKDDLIWLPSIVETGWRDSDRIGIWQTSANQRSNVNNSWLRTSCCNASQPGVLNTAGSFDSNLANASLSIRPALHLNLIEAINSAFDIWGNTQFVSDNLNLILQYISSTNTATTNASLLSSISSTIGSGAIKSSTIKTNANKVTDKAFINASSELVIKFGGLNWFATYLTKNNSGQVILTLWLADSGQLFGKGKTGSDGSVKYNIYGSASWNSGSPPYSDGASAISNNYGNSNIRTSYFSSTTNTASVFYNYLKTAGNYTAIGDFIVAPKDLNMQDSLYLQKNQSAKTILGFRYNLPNESFSNLINYSNPYKALSLSASTTNYTSWQNDKLWLPSLSEVGLGSNNAISTNSTASNNLRISGLWGLSTAQRSNTNKTATWLRSGHITDKNLAYTISSDGLDYGYATLNTQNAIRPALHLNLTLACQYAS